jgi:hypothetical protein
VEKEMHVIECEQCSPTWFELHRGILTASNAKKIITPGGKPSEQMHGVICQLLGEIANPGPNVPEGYVSQAMIQGTTLEPEARRYYELTRNVDVKQVGMIFSDDYRFACSPDFIVEEDGVIVGAGEVKAPQYNTQIARLLDGEFPSEIRPQCHYQLAVTGLPWVDFMSYRSPLREVLIRVFPDAYTLKVRAAMEVFWTEFVAARERIFPGRDFSTWTKDRIAKIAGK